MGSTLFNLLRVQEHVLSGEESAHITVDRIKECEESGRLVTVQNASSFDGLDGTLLKDLSGPPWKEDKLSGNKAKGRKKKKRKAVMNTALLSFGDGEEGEGEGEGEGGEDLPLSRLKKQKRKDGTKKKKKSKGGEREEGREEGGESEGKPADEQQMSSDSDGGAMQRHQQSSFSSREQTAATETTNNKPDPPVPLATSAPPPQPPTSSVLSSIREKYKSNNRFVSRSGRDQNSTLSKIKDFKTSLKKLKNKNEEAVSYHGQVISDDVQKGTDWKDCDFQCVKHEDHLQRR